MEALRYGILSSSSIAPRFIAGVRAANAGQILALSSRDSEKARLKADQWQIPRAYGSHKALLELRRQNVRGDEYGKHAFHDVAEQREQTAGHAAQARHVGGADVAAAGFAGIDTLERFGDDKAERHCAKEEGKDDTEGKNEMAHEAFPCWKVAGRSAIPF